MRAHFSVRGRKNIIKPVTFCPAQRRDGGGEDTNLSTTTLGFIEKYLAAADLTTPHDADVA